MCGGRTFRTSGSKAKLCTGAWLSNISDCKQVFKERWNCLELNRQIGQKSQVANEDAFHRRKSIHIYNPFHGYIQACLQNKSYSRRRSRVDGIPKCKEDAGQRAQPLPVGHRQIIFHHHVSLRKWHQVTKTSTFVSWSSYLFSQEIHYGPCHRKIRLDDTPLHAIVERDFSAICRLTSQNIL